MITKQNHRNWLYILAWVLVLPALLINLGVVPFIDDEGIRSIVALEMKLRGNYILPTMNGVNYYSKPPLFNWILILFFESAGVWNEWVARIPTVISTLGLGGIIYYYLHKRYTPNFAFLNALAFVTCGRMLFWDSMLGLIDVTYSLVTFAAFMSVFVFFEKRKFLTLFAVSYFLSAIAFLLKGLPTVLFQGFTLGIWFLYKREFKRLFYWQHFVGALAFVIPVGLYYILYFQYYTPMGAMKGLWVQAAAKTTIEKGWIDTFAHLFTFPFEMVYHFLPWSLMALLLLQKDIRRLIFSDDLIAFVSLTFGINILVYWVSPEVYPRFVLMLAPLLFLLFFYLYEKSDNNWQLKTVKLGLFAFATLTAISPLVPLFVEKTQDSISLLYLKSFGLTALMALLYWIYIKYKESRLLTLGVMVLVLRIGFNFFILPIRAQEDRGSIVKEESISLAREFKDTPIYIYEGSDCQYANSFYMTREKQAIIHRKRGEHPNDGVYIVDRLLYPDVKMDSVSSIYMRHGKNRYFAVGKLKE